MKKGQKHENGTKTHNATARDTRRGHHARHVPPARRRKPSLVGPVLLVYTAVGRASD